MTPSVSISWRKPAARSQQIRLAGRPGLPYGGHDAAAGPRDVEIAPASKPLLELVGPPAGKGQMGVAVYQPGNHQPPTRVDPLGPPVLRRQLLLRADPADHAIVIPRHRGVGNGVDVALPALGATGGELGDVVQGASIERHPAQRLPLIDLPSEGRPRAPSPSQWRARSPHPRGA